MRYFLRTPDDLSIKAMVDFFAEDPIGTKPYRPMNQSNVLVATLTEIDIDAAKRHGVTVYPNLSFRPFGAFKHHLFFDRATWAPTEVPRDEPTVRKGLAQVSGTHQCPRCLAKDKGCGSHYSGY